LFIYRIDNTNEYLFSIKDMNYIKKYYNDNNLDINELDKLTEYNIIKNDNKIFEFEKVDEKVNEKVNEIMKGGFLKKYDELLLFRLYKIKFDNKKSNFNLNKISLNKYKYLINKYINLSVKIKDIIGDMYIGDIICNNTRKKFIYNDSIVI
jgi:hypothetical protein